MRSDDGTFEIVGTYPEEYVAAMQGSSMHEVLGVREASPPEDLLSDPEATKRMFERARDNIQHRTNMKQLKYVCMYTVYVRMNVRMYVCMYVCMYVRKCVWPALCCAGMGLCAVCATHSRPGRK
jgi:hypothetical protein